MKLRIQQPEWCARKHGRHDFTSQRRTPSTVVNVRSAGKAAGRGRLPADETRVASVSTPSLSSLQCFRGRNSPETARQRSRPSRAGCT